jgi:phosphoserine aminotransferase
MRYSTHCQLLTVENSSMSERVFNFSAGPAVLPVNVLEEAQQAVVELDGLGMSILEISHRSQAFDAILAEAKAL